VRKNRCRSEPNWYYYKDLFWDSTIIAVSSLIKASLVGVLTITFLPTIKSEIVFKYKFHLKEKCFYFLCFHILRKIDLKYSLE
jgi:hypothetical protein